MEFKVNFSQEEVDMILEELDEIKNLGLNVQTIEEYIAHATMTHCRTMHIASSMMNDSDDFEGIISNRDNVHIGVLNMPVQLNDTADKEEFSEYLSDVLNQAVQDFNDRNNNGPLN